MRLTVLVDEVAIAASIPVVLTAINARAYDAAQDRTCDGAGTRFDSRKNRAGDRTGSRADRGASDNVAGLRIAVAVPVVAVVVIAVVVAVPVIAVRVIAIIVAGPYPYPYGSVAQPATDKPAAASAAAIANFLICLVPSQHAPYVCLSLAVWAPFRSRIEHVPLIYRNGLCACWCSFRDAALERMKKDSVNA